MSSAGWLILVAASAERPLPSKRLTVLKRTVIDSSVLQIQLSHHLFTQWFRKWASPHRPPDPFFISFCRSAGQPEPFLHLKSGLNKMSFPDDPSKQSWQGADNKESPCRTKPSSAWARCRRRMWAPAEHVGGPRGWSSCASKTEWRPLRGPLLLSLPPLAVVLRRCNFTFLPPPPAILRPHFFFFVSESQSF